jgi:dihydropyrimidine dehydrogenase (NAD+) subunit PreA
MVQQLAGDPECGLPVSGIGGISGWREAAEFLLLGCHSLQVCTAVMHYGYRIVEDMIEGLSNWMDDKGFHTLDDFRGLSLARVTEWKHLDLNFKIVARVHSELCIGCDLCYIACWDGAHQCIHIDGVATPQQLVAQSGGRIAHTPAVVAVDTARTPVARIPKVDEQECVGCNLCWLVCPVEGCITMDRIDTGDAPQTWAQRTAISQPEKT